MHDARHVLQTHAPGHAWRSRGFVPSHRERHSRNAQRAEGASPDAAGTGGGEEKGARHVDPLDGDPRLVSLRSAAARDGRNSSLADAAAACAAGAVSVGVIARFDVVEAPYLNEWVAWYVRRLGFSHAYVVSQDPERELYAHLAPELAEHVTWVTLHMDVEDHDRRFTAWTRAMLRHHVRETYVMTLDADELLWLPRSTPRIADWVCSRPMNCAAIYWAPVGCRKPLSTSAIECLKEGDVSLQVGRWPKYVGRMAALNLTAGSEQPLNWHKLPCSSREKLDNPAQPSSEEFLSTPHILHFVQRSLLHMVIKSTFQRGLAGGRTGEPSHAPRLLAAWLGRTNIPPVKVGVYPWRLLYSLLVEYDAQIRGHNLATPEMIRGLDLEPTGYHADHGALWEQIDSLLTHLKDSGVDGRNPADAPAAVAARLVECLGVAPPADESAFAAAVDGCMGLRAKLDMGLVGDIEFEPEYPTGVTQFMVNGRRAVEDRDARLARTDPLRDEQQDWV